MAGPTIKLQGGPGHGQIYTEADFRARILAAQRMGHTEPTGAGWALGYAPGSPPHWVWQDGVNCHPVDQVDPELLRPYGAFLNDPASATTAAAPRPTI